MPKAYMVSSVGSSGPSAKRLVVSLNRLLVSYRPRDRCLTFHGRCRTNFNIVRVGLNEPSDNVRGVLLFGWDNRPECLLLAQSGHSTTEFRCPLLGVKRTSINTERPGLGGYRSPF